MSSARSSLLLASFLALPLGFACAVGVAVSACDARVIDVGANDADPSTASPSSLDSGLAKSAYGCAEWIDEELYALRDGSCGGACATAPADPYKLESKKGLIAATAGEWLFCEGSLGPEGAIGVEFAPGCRLYFLRRDDEGHIVRGTEKAFQAKYDIFDPRPEGQPRRIDVHVDHDVTLTFDVVAYRCPEHLRLLAPGKRIELAPGYEDAGRSDPTR